MKRVFWGGTLALLLTFTVVGQSNDVIDELLSQDQALAGEVSYVVLVAVGDVAEDATVETALALVRERGFFPASSEVQLGDLSFLLMETFGVSGGLMYTIAPGPRYATRELAFHGLIAGRTHPNRRLSGYEALQLVERFLHWRDQG